MTRYSPRGHNHEQAVDAVEHRETAPPEHLAKFGHRYVHLSTRHTLTGGGTTVTTPVMKFATP